MTHPLIAAIEEIRTSPFTTNSRLDDVPMRPIPTHQRQIVSRYVYIMKYIDKGNI